MEPQNKRKATERKIPKIMPSFHQYSTVQQTGANRRIIDKNQHRNGKTARGFKDKGDSGGSGNRRIEKVEQENIVIMAATRCTSHRQRRTAGLKCRYGISIIPLLSEANDHSKPATLKLI